MTHDDVALIRLRLSQSNVTFSQHDPATQLAALVSLALLRRRACNTFGTDLANMTVQVTHEQHSHLGPSTTQSDMTPVASTVGYDMLVGSCAPRTVVFGSVP